MNVMSSRPMTPAQTSKADALRADFEALYAKLHPNGTIGHGDQSARLYAVAKTQLEIACAMAVKAVSRDGSI